MNESNISSTTNNSINSKDTESNSLNTSFEIQYKIPSYQKSHIIKAMAAELEDIILENSKSNIKISKDQYFYINNVPEVSIENYLRHIMKYSDMNVSSLIISNIYLDRFCHKYNYCLSMNTIHRLLLVCIYISIKFNEDRKLKGYNYANIAKVSTKELFELEYNFSSLLNFDFFVQNDLFYKYLDYYKHYNI
jgi:hypothetical protein